MVSFKNVDIHFDSVKVLDDFSVHIGRGEKVVLSGPSGSGKSTILNAIMGFVKVDNGEVEVDGQIVGPASIHSIRKKISWLPQDVNFDVKLCKELVYYPFRFQVNKILAPGEDEVKKLLLTLLLPSDILNRQVDEISGGQKQRLALASVLMLKRPVILLDEPSSALDVVSTDVIVKILSDQKDVTVISSSHDPEWVQQMDRVIKLEKSN